MITQACLDELGLHKVRSFPPVIDKSCHTLILGTCPGKKSLANNCYYADGRNHFWKVISRVFNNAEMKTIEDKYETLTSNGIALWDVIAECYRSTSSDSGILNPVPQDFKSFFKKHPQIQVVLFNGRNPQKYYKKLIAEDFGLKQEVLISSSSMANRHYKEDERFKEWQKLLQR